MNGRIKVTVDDAYVLAMIRRAPEELMSGIERLVTAAAINVQGEMRKQAPVGVHGLLRRGVKVLRTGGRLEADVAPTANYADDVEEGRGPRRVSVKEGSPLRAWAEFKGLNPYAVQAAIAKRGTKANPFVDRTYKETRDPQADFIASGVTRIVEGLSNA